MFSRNYEYNILFYYCVITHMYNCNYKTLFLTEFKQPNKLILVILPKSCSVSKFIYVLIIICFIYLLKYFI